MSPDNREPFGVAVRQRAEQKSVDNAENRRVGTDAEREREHGHGGEAGVLQQLAEGEAEILQQCVHSLRCDRVWPRYARFERYPCSKSKLAQRAKRELPPRQRAC